MMMATVSKSLLLVVATTMASVVFAEPGKKGDPGKIIGGDDAALGEYPYFVAMGVCGGALIAPDIVLTAAHCDSFEGQQVIVGAHQPFTLTEGSHVRFCETWKGDPKFRTGEGVNNYDFALCKLDEPVFIDSNVKLELNEFDSVPKTGKDLIVMGLGYTVEGGPNLSAILQDVQVPAVSNEVCGNEEYYGDDVTDNMVCAGFDEGGFDSCQGDSGGPLVRRKTNKDDGTIVDTHVGVVSWGEGCARPKKPGVYARTSKNLRWIKSTMCEMGSIADFCDDYPLPCDQELTITMTIDRYGSETSWVLKDFENNQVMARRYLLDFNTNQHKVCVRSNECYQLLLKDSFGDGMCFQGECGSYSFDLNGVEILSGNGDFQTSRTFDICTGKPNCKDDETFEYNGNPDRTCENWVGAGKKNKIRAKCKKDWLDGKIHDVCLQTCGEVGMGRCSDYF